jgi:hypothetical protein
LLGNNAAVWMMCLVILRGLAESGYNPQKTGSDESPTDHGHDVHPSVTSATTS